MQTAPKDQDAAAEAVFALRLVDRRTGAPLRANGAVLTIFTRTPDQSAAEALRGRDASVWQIRVERIATVDAAAQV
jgi:hypothetical protein